MATEVPARIKNPTGPITINYGSADAKPGHDYLYKEYELSYTQLRYYDDRSSTTLNFLYTLTTAIAGAIFAVVKFYGDKPMPWGALLLLSLVVLTGTVIVYLGLLQNRIYFVRHARQLNAIRRFLMEHDAGGFTDNQLYPKKDPRNFDPTSLHTYQLFGAALMSSLFAGLAIYTVTRRDGGTSLWPAVLGAIAAAAVEIGGGILYWRAKEDERPRSLTATQTTSASGAGDAVVGPDD